MTAPEKISAEEEEFLARIQLACGDLSPEALLHIWLTIRKEAKRQLCYERRPVDFGIFRLVPVPFQVNQKAAVKKSFVPIISNQVKKALLEERAARLAIARIEGHKYYRTKLRRARSAHKAEIDNLLSKYRQWLAGIGYSERERLRLCRTIKRACKKCGKVFHRGAGQIYCSRKCRDSAAWDRRKRRLNPSRYLIPEDAVLPSRQVPAAASPQEEASNTRSQCDRNGADRSLAAPSGGTGAVPGCTPGT